VEINQALGIETEFIDLVANIDGNMPRFVANKV